MSLAQTEVLKRKAVRAMLERLEPEVQEPPELSLKSRQELFGKYSSRSEEGWHQRLLRRLCDLGMLDSLVTHPLRTRVYVVRDSAKVLDALTDDDALTRCIWRREDTTAQVQPALPPPEVVTTEVAPTEDASPSNSVAAMAASSEEDLPAITLKLLAGMVDSLYYLRLKVESIESKLDANTKRLE